MSAAPAAPPTPAATQAPDGAEGGSAPPKKRRRLLLVVVGVVMLLLGAGAGYMFMSGADAEATDEDAEPAPVEEGEILDVGTLTTNLSGQSPRYARVGVGLVLAADANPATVESSLPLVKDAIITEISRHSAPELQGDAGVRTLRDGIGTSVTSLFDDGQVVRVVLTELLVQ